MKKSKTKTIGPDCSLCNRHLSKRQSNNFTVDWLASGQLQRVVNIVNPQFQASLSPQRTNVTQQSNYQLNYLPQPGGRGFVTTIKFDAQAGNEYFNLHLVPKSLWTKTLFASHLSFFSSRDQQVRVVSLLRIGLFLSGTSLTLNAQRKKNYLMKGDLIDIFAPPLACEQALPGALAAGREKERRALQLRALSIQLKFPEFPVGR